MSSDYPSDWDSRRHGVYERDGYQCQNCGAKGGPHGSTELHAHHIVPKSKGGTHKRSNLISLCRDCHNAIHGDSQAPTSINNSSVSTQEEFLRSLVNILENISDSEARSTDSLDRLITQLENAANGRSFTVEEYSSIRYNIIKQAFHVKQNVEKYDKDMRNYLSKDGQSDIDDLIDAVWDSIQAQINVVGHVDNLLMEFSDRDIICDACGEHVDNDAKYCNNCGKELQLTLMCDSCGSELDSSDNFCPDCGSEVQNGDTVDAQTEVSEKNIESNLNDIKTEVDNCINKAVFSQLQQRKFVEIWIEDRNVLWEYCPNCGFERGVLSTTTQAECILCQAEWEKRGILNRRWEVINPSNISSDTENNEDHWERLGHKRASEDEYKKYIPKLTE